MSFVITTGNKQYLVKNGQIVIVDRLSADVNSVIELPVIHTTGQSPTAKTIKATVVSHQKGEKIRVVKYKSKSRYHKQYGFRAFETVLKIEGNFDTGKPKTESIISEISPAKAVTQPTTAAEKSIKTTKKAAPKATAEPKIAASPKPTSSKPTK